ncbi:MAG: tol-pal system-associated acyl-CoA thioesterase [Magnetococcales bacterium]|nr:tol-pal system-associated acyl-CoA thioesterase [Magnetococcales bacterium]
MSIQERGFVWPIRVYYEDTDAGGVVYHSNYLNFMERARTEWLRKLGFGQNQLARESGLVFAVTQMSVRFVAPARLDDRLDVSVLVARQGRASLELTQEIWRKSDEKLLIQATAKIVLLNNRFKPTRFPAPFLAVLESG